MKTAAALLLLTTASPALAAGRLPMTAAPVLYDITVHPDATAMRFTGEETVTVDVKTPTTTLVLNAAELEITRATFDGAAVGTRADATTQTLTVTLPKAASVGRHQLTFAWTGKINTTAAGFFSIDYGNTDGSKARMLVTQFEAADARRFAPMWDEPAFKAKFRLSTVAPIGQTAFSNMPAASVTKQADGASLYRFGETPVMSSYLLFLGQGDVERRTVMSGKTEIGVITRRGVSAQGDYALASAKRLLQYYNDYFGQPYPLPKLDMIAGPGSSQFFGAMENWGAIFYFEPELLFDPARATESGRQRIYTVVAHEMAHQWFGDLVTMAWWDDIWLNEGFASWMEGKASNDLNPQWSASAEAVASTREAAMAADATAATHPIVRHVESVDQISQAFDNITYQKGQAVIGMIESTLGPDKFRAGIRRYMAKYKYGNTATDQLWAELEAASGQKIADIAHDFTLQPGVPLVTLTGEACTGGIQTARLTQTRYGLDASSKTPMTWRVPLRVATLGVSGGPAGKPTSAVVRGPAETTVSVEGCGPIVLNLGKGSYTRVRYDAATHQALVSSFARLALADQLGTLSDDFGLALSGDQDFASYAAIQAAVGADANPLVWATVAGEMASLNAQFRGTPLEGPLRARTNALLSPVLMRVGLAPTPSDSTLVTNLREGLLGVLGAAGDPALAQRARGYVARLRSDSKAIPAAIRSPILNTFARNASAPEYEQLSALAIAEKNPVARNDYVRLLGLPRDEALARRSLDLIGGATLTAPQRASLLRAIANAHPDLAFGWALDHLDLVNTFVEESSRARYIVSLGAGSTDPGMPARIQAFADQHLPAQSRGSAREALAQMAARREVRARLQPGVSAWLAAR